MMQENINVMARVRPLSERAGLNQKSCLSVDAANSTIYVEKNKEFYKFNKVFDENASQEAIFDTVAKPIINGFLEGKNGTIFAYGQTASGKTFTMLGPNINEHNDDNGIIPRTIKEIFSVLDAKVENKPDSFKYSIKCSFIEIYNEQQYDLLKKTTLKNNINKIAIYQKATFGKAEEKEVESYDACLKLLKHGWNQRTTASTSMNERSSRSHAIFIIRLATEELAETKVITRSSCLNLVDLAGFERQSQTNNIGVQIRESYAINNSLSTFTHVIRQILDGKKFISYLDSKLTTLLRDSLGGNSKTTVIFNIHQDAQFITDTVSVLEFAKSVKEIKNTISINKSVSCEDVETWKTEVLRLRQENEQLKSHQQHDEITDKEAYQRVMLYFENDTAQTKARRVEIQKKTAEYKRRLAMLSVKKDDSDSDDEL
uniref:Kinesin motor domain-containing protein n=1 Tax=Panagrolaimus davidi TaxID=227884 RepID=A0A914QVB8_9BILA